MLGKKNINPKQNNWIKWQADEDNLTVCMENLLPKHWWPAQAMQFSKYEALKRRHPAVSHVREWVLILHQHGIQSNSLECHEGLPVKFFVFSIYWCAVQGFMVLWKNFPTSATSLQAVPTQPSSNRKHDRAAFMDELHALSSAFSLHFPGT